MKNRCWIIIFILISCNNNSTIQERTTDIEIATDTLTDSVEENIAVEEVADSYPTTEGLPLSILYTGVFHNDEVSPDMENKGWFGLFKDRDKYFVAPTTIKITQAYDVVLDEDENNPESWTGWQINSVNIDTCLFLISGSSKLDSYNITYQPKIGNIRIAIGESVSFDFNGIIYTFSATGEIVPSEWNADEKLERNYRLYIKTMKDGMEKVQLLAATPQFDDKNFYILFTGDIDNDSFPDFIIDTSNHYNVFRPTLYFSSYADDNEIVKTVAIHTSVGC